MEIIEQRFEEHLRLVQRVRNSKKLMKDIALARQRSEEYSDELTGLRSQLLNAMGPCKYATVYGKRVARRQRGRGRATLVVLK